MARGISRIAANGGDDAQGEEGGEALAVGSMSSV